MTDLVKVWAQRFDDGHCKRFHSERGGQTGTYTPPSHRLPHCSRWDSVLPFSSLMSTGVYILNPLEPLFLLSRFNVAF